MTYKVVLVYPEYPWHCKILSSCLWLGGSFLIQKFATEIILLVIKNINNALLLSTSHRLLFD